MHGLRLWRFPARQPVLWRGSSLQDLRRFPPAARPEAARQLNVIQHGGEPSDWKPVMRVAAYRARWTMSKSKRVERTKRPTTRRTAGPSARPRVVRERASEGTTHATPADGNVFADLGFPPAEAANLLLRSELMTGVMTVIERRSLTQAQAAKLFGVTQPRISDLARGKIDRFTVDALVNMLAHAGVKVRLVIGRSAA